MKVRRCFGHSGEKECLGFMCNNSKECYECYLKYFQSKKQRYFIRLSEVIDKFMIDNNLTY